MFLLALFILYGVAGFAQQTFKVNLWDDGEIAGEDYKDAVLHC